MCDCFHLAFPNWHAASSGTGAGRRLRGPDPGTEADSICDEPSQFTEGERPRPQGSSPVEEFPETEKYTDSDKECETEHEPYYKRGKKTKKSGFGSMFDKHSTPKMSKLKDVHSPESGVIVKTAKDGCAEGLIYGGGGKEGIFIKDVVPESPASKSLKLKQGDQLLSATVYFDNVSYEDAIQILEHAQAYKVKLCLKRTPDITEPEPAIESDIIPEEELYAPEIRQQGKTKTRGDARISWPKFPSFGKGRKSRFTRSHSSSEADEQRKLELSPTTSDTESPIKSQDALKGKKKHKMKLSFLTKRGRVSSSEEKDTDASTTGQIIHQSQETPEMLSPDCLESPSGETPVVYTAEALTVEEESDLKHVKKLIEPETVQHKVELITIDNTLKTTDLTVALADQDSGIKSPDGKKKKKEKSELKMKILGKDKHKKDTKVKSSPKRLKTLGASIEKPDQPDNVIPDFTSHTELHEDQLALDRQIISSESSRVISAKSVTTPMSISVPKVELDISDFLQKSPQKDEETTKKGKDIKQKQETTTGPTFKLPKIGLSDIATEEPIQQINVNVEECTNIKQLTIEGKDVKEDPYDKLSKGNLSTTQLPKREDIEIPGMEDVSKRTTTKGTKTPKAGFTGPYEEIQTETVQMSIDVNSVKEAVSKLPGFKLPKVDTSGMPIPEEITVIDANAQRISVKTPTKVVDAKTKHETYFTKFDVTASPEISKTSNKLPKIKPADLTSEKLLSKTKVDLKKPEMEYKAKQKQSDKDSKTGLHKQEDIFILGKENTEEVAICQAQETEKTKDAEGIKSEYELTATLSSKESDKKSKKSKIVMPSFGIAKPDIRIPNIGIDLSKQNISDGDEVKGFFQEAKTSKTETGKDKRHIIGVMPDIKIPETETSAITIEGEAPSDNIQYIDLVGGLPAKKDGSITGFQDNLDVTKAKADVSFPEIRGEVKDVDAEELTIQQPKIGAVTPDISVNVPDTAKDINIDGAEVKSLEREGKGSKFKMPNLGIAMPKVKGPKMDLSLPKRDVDVRLPEDPEFTVTVGKVDASTLEQKMEVVKPELEIQPEGEHNEQGSKIKMPKFGIKMPKFKGPEFDLRLSKKDIDVTLPEAKAEIKIAEAPDIDITLESVDVSISEKNLEVKKPELEIQPQQSEGELDGRGSKFKMPKLEIKMPKIKGPEFDSSLSKKDIDITLPEAESKAPDVDITLGSVDVDVSTPGQRLEVKNPELDIKTFQTEGELDGQESKFKMPKFGIKMPKFKGPEFDLSLSKKDVDVTLPEAKAEVKIPEAPDTDIALESVNVSISEKNLEVKKPELEIQPLQSEGELDGRGSKFKVPKFGIKMPKIKGSEFDSSLSKKDIDVPEATVGVKISEIDVTQGNRDISIPEKMMEVEKPQLQIKSLQIEAETHGQGGKFKMPKLGIAMPKIKGPEIDLSTSKEDVDVTLPEAKAKVKLPDAELIEPSAKMEIKAHEIKGTGKAAEGSPSTFKMPTFKLPKFGTATPNVSVEISDENKDIQIPETQQKTHKDSVKVGIIAPNIDIETTPSLDVKTAAELDGKGSKFKMPKFGISLPKLKGPDIDLKSSKKDVDVILLEAEAKVNLPEPPNVDVSLGKADVSISEEKLELEMKPLQTEVELDKQGSKFKVPKFGLSKKDADVTLPEAKAEIKIPEVELKEHSAKVEIKSVEKKKLSKSTDGSPSKFKMPTFKLPKFGIGTPNISAEVPDNDNDVKLSGADINIPEEGPVVNIATPCTDIEDPEQDGKGSKFKMPHLSFSMPKVKGPKIDSSLSKKDAEVTITEAKADVKIPEALKMDANVGKADLDVPEADAEVKLPEAPKIVVEIKPPECEAGMEGHAGKFKLPKFGIKMPKIKGPQDDLSLSKKDVDVKLPEAPKIDVNLEKVDVSIQEAKMEVKTPELEMQALQTEDELDAQGDIFKMPKFGIKMPKIKGPEFDLSLSKKDVNLTLPETKDGVKLPDTPTIDASLGKVKVLIPEAKVEVEKPELEIRPLHTEAELEGQGSKFKMPKFGMSMPKVKGPEFHLGSKKDVDVTLPQVKAEVNFPDAELQEPSAKVDIKAPEIEVAAKDTEGSPSKFKMPTFSFSMPKVKGPQIDLSLSKKDTDIKLPETEAEIKFQKTTETDVILGKADTLIPEAKMEVKIPELVTKPLQTDVKLEGQGGGLGGQGSKFKMPKFGMSMPKVKGPEIDFSLSKKDADDTLLEANEEVNLPDVELKQPSTEVEMKASETEAKLSSMKGSPSKFKLPTFKFPKFGAATPNVSIEVPDMDKEIKIDGTDMHVSVPQKDVDIPEVTAGIHLPEVEVKEPVGSVVIEQSPSVEVDAKLKKPRFSLPGFSFSKPSVKAPEVDVTLQGVNVAIPEGKVEVKGTEVDMKSTECEAETDQGSKFKMPKFGKTMPKVSEPEVDLCLSKKDVDMTLPEAKVEVKLGEVEVKEPSAEVEIKAPKIKVQGSPSKYKMPTFKLPKFGLGTPSATVEVPVMEKDIAIDGADIKIPEEVLAVNIAAPSIDTDVKLTGPEHEGKGNKFKLPNLSFSVPQVEGPDIDLSLSKKDVDVTLPEAKAEVQLPDAEVKEPSAKVEIKAPGIVEGSPSKFKMPTFKLPKFGAATPQVSVEVPDLDKDIKVDGADLTLPEPKAEVKIPDVDIKEPTGSISVPQAPMTEDDAKLRKSSWTLPRFSFSKTSVKPLETDVNLDIPEVDVKLPEDKVDVHLPDIDIKQSSGISIEEAPAADLDAKLKKSRFSLPKFSFSKQSIKEPEVDVSLPDVDVSLPEGNKEVKQPELELKQQEGDAELDGQESKFKMPKFGISMPKVKGPEIDLSLSKKDADVTLPEAEVQLPDVKIEIKASETEVQTGNVKGSPSKLKMPTFTLPKFGAATPKVSVEVPDVNKDIRIDGAKLEVAKEGATVDVTAPSIDTEGLSVDVKAKRSETEGSGSRFKMPKFGISIPKMKGPEIDLSLSKKDVDVPLPEAKAEVKLPDVEIKHPEATVSVPDAPDGVDINIKIPEEVLAVNIAAPSIDTDGPSLDVKLTRPEHEGKGSRFKLLNLSFSVPQVKGPDIDLSLSKKDVDVTLPEAKAEVQLPDAEVKEPSAKVEIKAPGIDVQTSNVEGSPSKFKMPTFKLPKFGAATPQVSVEVPDLDKDIKVDGADLTLPEPKAEVKIPDVDIKEPTGSISVPQAPMTEDDAKLRKSSWTLSRFSFSKTSVKPLETDVNLDIPEVDVKLPEDKVDVHLPDIDIKQSSGISIEEAPAADLDAKLKKSRFSLPKFSFSKQSIKEPEVDVSLPDVDVSLPEGNVEVKQPELELKQQESDAQLDGQESKFKMPKFGISMPKVKGPEIDLSLSKKDVDVTLPEAEVQLSDVKMEIKASETEVQTGNVKGSPSKLKMPTFTLPKFGAATPKVSVEVPDVNKDVRIDRAKLEAPKEGATVDVTAPSIDTEGLSVDVKAKGTETEGSGSRFKMPKFGISMPKVKGPEIDLSLSKKDVDVTLPEAEIQLPDVKMEIKAPGTEAQTGNVEGSPSKLKMPTFTLPKFGAATPKVNVEVPDVNKDTKIDGAKLEVPKEGATVDVTAPSIDTEGLSVEVKEPEPAISVPHAQVEVEAKLKRPNWTFPKFSFSRTGGKAPDVDVNLETAKVDVTSPESKAEFCTPDFEDIGSSMAISMEEPPAAELDANLKKNKFSLPRFSFSKSSAKEPEVSADLPHVDVSLPEGEVKVKQPEIEIKAPELEVEYDRQGSKFKLPKFGIALPKAKVPEVDVDVTLPEVKAEVKLPEAETKEFSTNVEIKTSETQAKSKDVGGSPLKFKMPTLKMAKFGGDSYVEAPDVDKETETDGATIKEDVTVNIKGQSIDIKTDASKVSVSDFETPKTETDSVGLGSPIKFKLPSFKMPKLNFSRPKPEDEYVSVDTECKDDQLEVESKGESTSPKMTLTSFGEILKNIDVEFNVPKTDKEENLDTSKEVHGTAEANGKEIKQDSTKSPERTGWFKFPKFGLSSPSEPAKMSGKGEHKDEKSPVGETVDEEVSPTCSVQSSDAFADISSTMTSEHIGLSLSSPTKVTVKYSDPNSATGLGEMHSHIITSTTKTELISVEPNLPEKITILSSGLSSSSEDTLRLESGRIHVITSNIQATPEAQQAKLLTAVQVQSTGDLPLRSEKHSVSESQETIVITKQITHVFDSAEPISDETATSIQRLRDSVHSEKMKFFDRTKK